MLILHTTTGERRGWLVFVSIFASRRQRFKFTVMVLLMDLFIYLVVVWKEAMNLLGLLKRTVLVRSHLPY